MPLDLNALREELGIAEDGEGLERLEALVAEYNDLEEGNGKLRDRNRKLARKPKTDGGLTLSKLQALLDGEAEPEDEAGAAIAALQATSEEGLKRAAKLERRLKEEREAREAGEARLAAQRQREALAPHVAKLVKEDFQSDAYDWLGSHVREADSGGFEVIGADGELAMVDGKPVSLDALVRDLGAGKIVNRARPGALVGHQGKEQNQAPTGGVFPIGEGGGMSRTISRAEMRKRHEEG